MNSPLVVTLGASALRAVAGPLARLADMRGRPIGIERAHRCCRQSIPPISFDCQTLPQKRRRPAPLPTTSSKQLLSP